mgnify:CR=1 FL=1
MIRFSIIVVCLNPGAGLNKTVESILAQTFGDYEMIIKDGGSTDGSIEGLPMDSRIRIFHQKDRGIYDAMNQAVEQVKGEYVYFLNCGDLFYDREVLQQLNQQIRKVEAQNKTAEYIFYGDIYAQQTGQRVVSNPSMDAFGCYRNVPCHQACFYAAALMRKKNFNLRYRVRADYEHFLWCFFQGKAKMVYLPLVIAGYEGGGFSETKENRKISTREHKEIVKKYMKPVQVWGYGAVMFLSLSWLRTWLAENKATARIYHKIKEKLYRRQRKNCHK